MPGNSRGIVVVATLMIAFGVAEVVTAFRHSFLGLHTADSAASLVAGFTIGSLYAAAGALVLRPRQIRLRTALICLGLDVVGRIAMAIFGLFPVTTRRQVASMLAGTLIVIGFGVYLWSRRRCFA